MESKSLETSLFTRGSVAYINRLERQILVHSLLYYGMDENIVSDQFFDSISKELADCIIEFPENFKKTAYVKTFKKFDGSTGADLNYKVPEIEKVADYLVKKQ